MSKKLNSTTGNIVNLNETKNGKPFFRKPTDDENELIIAKRIQKNPHPHIVKVYHVGDNYIDMELVNTNVSKKNCQEQITGLRSAKKHMQKNGIVYIDWKVDNTGRGDDGKIKVYDFNMSGLLRRKLWYFNNNWNRRPMFTGYLLKNAEAAGQINPIAADDWIFERKFAK